MGVRIMKHQRLILAVTIFLGVTAGAFAEPALQLYLEGATYNSATETWIASGDLGSLRLWVIAQSPVHDVKLAVAYASTETPTIGLTGSTTGGHGGFTDPSVAPAASYTQTGAPGSIPTLGDGSALEKHGIYGTETMNAWQEFNLGDFTLLDSPIADFMSTFPPPGSKMGQINVYEVTVADATMVHFDAYNHYAGATSGKFAPFSHDAGGPPVPAPAAAVLGLIGLGTINLLRRRLLAA